MTTEIGQKKFSWIKENRAIRVYLHTVPFAEKPLIALTLNVGLYIKYMMKTYAFNRSNGHATMVASCEGAL